MTSYQQPGYSQPGYSQPGYEQPAYSPPGYPQPTTDDPSMQDPSMKEKAADAVDQGKQAAGQVAQSATERAHEVSHEAARQARDLAGEAREHVRRQAGDQHRAVVSNLRSLSAELASMVDRSEQPGTATELVAQARTRVDGVASWLDERQPGDLVDEVRTFARRRPGTFLLGALAAGVVVGRLTRGAVAAHTDDEGTSAGSTGPTTVLPTADPAPALPPVGFEAETTAPGYSMGGHYADPPGGERPTPEQGYGATSTYGDGGTEAYPAGGYSNGVPR